MVLGVPILVLGHFTEKYGKAFNKPLSEALNQCTMISFAENKTFIYPKKHKYWDTKKH